MNVPAGSGLEGDAVVGREDERLGQQCDRISVGGATDAALEGADGMRAEASPLRQLLLREASSAPVAPEQVAEGDGPRGDHDGCPVCADRQCRRMSRDEAHCLP